MVSAVGNSSSIEPHPVINWRRTSVAVNRVLRNCGSARRDSSDRRDIAQQVRQMLFAALAPTQLYAGNSGCPFVLALTDRPAILPQLSFGEPLAP
jgi:hypothetical protein